MSHEISLSPVPPENNIESVERQPPLPSPKAYATIIQPIPPPATTKKPLKNKRIVRIRPIRPTKTTPQPQPQAPPRENWFHELRGWFMLVAVQVAAMTYASGLTPPGGFWPDNNDSHIAGNPILLDKFKRRYTTFYYANGTAFMSSLIIIISLLFNTRNHGSRKVNLAVLNVNTVLCLVSLTISYVAGSNRRASTSVYIIILAMEAWLVLAYNYVDFLFPSWINMTRRHTLARRKGET